MQSVRNINLNLNTFEHGMVLPSTTRTVIWKCPYNKALIKDFSFNIYGHKGLSQTFIKVEKRGMLIRDNISQFAGVDYFTGDNDEIKEQCNFDIKKNDRIVLVFKNVDPDTVSGLEMSMAINLTLLVESEGF